MKKLQKLSVIFLAMMLAFCIIGCDEDKGDDSSGGGPSIDYTNYVSNFSIKVKNDANIKLVAFKGAPSTSSLISGIPIGGGEHGLKKDSVLFATTGDFVLFIVTEEDYLANINNLSSLANKPFTRIYAFYNAGSPNNMTYNISAFLGGEKQILLNNNTDYNVELRRNGIHGELIGYAGQSSYNTTFNVEAGTYLVFPVFRTFNKNRGEIITVYPKDQEGLAMYEYFSLTGSTNTVNIQASKYLLPGIELKTGSAYLVVNNGNQTGMSLYDGFNIIRTSTGGEAINPNEYLTFQIDMAKNPVQEGLYMESRKMSQFKIGTPVRTVDVPEFTFQTDMIYEIHISGTGNSIQLSAITEVGPMTFGN